MRPVVSTGEEARKEFEPRPARVQQLEREMSLPFDRLGGDEFEVFCYLLLKAEHPDDEIIYYGKTGDSGRDIVWIRKNGSVELIQCKRYSGNVGVGEIRKELAKLFTNLHSGEIPIEPDRVARISFYASPDLTADAKDLLRYPEKWREVAEKHLGESPSPDLLEFALSWWPREGFHVEMGLDLTGRTKPYPDLRDEFFEVRKVIVGTVDEAVEKSKTAFRDVLAESGLGRQVNPQISDRTWESFFEDVEQKNASLSYLEEWPGLTPDQRFEPPREYPEILGAVQRQPVTFLIGPPAAGKTFIVLQMLWDAYLRGLRVRWIAPEMFRPTDGPIPSAEGLPDMKERIEILTRRLGLKPRRAPVDHHEFIATNLEPNSLVYIEDPFGKRDDEFDYSLHTYSFFDLDKFVEAVSESAVRASCHIVVSSREGLFDRWLDERQGRGLPASSALLRLSGESFGHEQLENLAVRLARAKGFDAPEEIASEISYRIEYPYEVESVLRALPLDADLDQVAEEVEKYRNGLKEALRKTLAAETDEEILFLVILASGCTDPKTWYLRLHERLDLPGEAENTLEAAVRRYRAFIIRRPASRLYVGETYFGPDSDEELFPSHPIVAETISEYLKGHASQGMLLDNLARVLAAVSEDRRAASKLSRLALYLLSFGIGIQTGPAQDSMTTVLFDHGGLSLNHILPLARMLISLDETFKARMLAYFQLERQDASDETSGTRTADDFESHKRSLLVEMASTLTSVDVPATDAWRILRLLLQNTDVMRRSSHDGLYAWGHPWSYLMEHLREAPRDLLSKLERIANGAPQFFAYMMGEALVKNWESAPEAFRSTVFAKVTLDRPQAQKNVLQGIARHWEEAPQELRELFLRQAKHENPKVRSEAASAAWIYRRENTATLEQVLMDAAGDPDLSVPLGIFHSLGTQDSDRRFARAVFERADSKLAAEMIFDLAQPSFEEIPQWKLDLVRDCLAKGGDRAESILAFLHYRGTDERYALTPSAREWRASIPDEPEPIRLGALWAYGSSNGKSPVLAPGEAIALIESLGSPYRGLALAYLSAHSSRLPQSVREHIESLETAQGSDGEAVRAGKKHQNSREANHPWWFLPLIEQEKTEEIASTEARP